MSDDQNWDDTESDAYVDTFVIADTLDPDNVITVYERPDEGGVRLGSPVADDDNVGSQRIIAKDGEVLDTDFSATLGVMKGGKFPQYALKFGTGFTGYGWLGKGSGLPLTDPVFIDSTTGAKIIRSMSAAEHDAADGCLYIVYEKDGDIWYVRIDPTNGELSTQKKIITGGLYPAAVYHKATGRWIVIYTDSETKVVYRRYYRYVNGSFTDSGEQIAFDFTDWQPINAIKMKILPVGGTDRILAVIGADTTEIGFRINGIIGSDDGGDTWDLLAAIDDIYDSHMSDFPGGDIDLETGLSGSGHIAVLTINLTWNSVSYCPVVLTSKDGKEWTLVGPWWGSDSSESSTHSRVHFKLLALDWNLPVNSIPSVTNKYPIGKNWFAVSKFTTEQFKMEMTRFLERSPANWYDSGSSLLPNHPKNYRDGFGEMDQRVVLECQNPPVTHGIKDLAVFAWRGNVYAVVIDNDTDAGTYSAFLFTSQKWQRPAEKSEYKVAWFAGMGDPDDADWTKVTTGTASFSTTDGAMQINAQAASTLYFEQDSSGSVPLDDLAFGITNGSASLGAKIKAGFKIQTASATSSHGIEAKICDISDTTNHGYVQCRVLFTGLNKFRLYDSVAGAYVGSEYTLGTAADEGKEMELILGIGNNDGSSCDVTLWVRIAEGAREMANFVKAVHGSLSAGTSGSTQYHALRWGALYTAMSTGSTVEWRHIAITDFHDYACLNEGQEEGQARLFNAGGQVLPLTGEIDLTQNAKIVPIGGSPQSNDLYTVAAEGRYPVENFFKTPTGGWRSTTDGAEETMVFLSLPGSGGKGFSPGCVALFGTNIAEAKAEFSNTDSFASPDVTVPLDAYLSRGTLGAQRGWGAIIASWTRRWRPGTGKTNMDNNWNTNLQNHELAGKYLVMTSGDAIGNVYFIIDNFDGVMSFVTDSPYSSSPYEGGADVGDTFSIFGNNLVSMPDADQETASQGVYAYMKLTIPAQNTAEGYYAIKNIVVKNAHEIETDAKCRMWDALTRSIKFPTDMKRGDDGTLYPRSLGPSRRELTLQWKAMNPSQRIGLEAILERIQGSSIPVVYIPIQRRNESSTESRNMPEAGLYRMAIDKFDSKPMAALECWEGPVITLEEIP